MVSVDVVINRSGALAANGIGSAIEKLFYHGRTSSGDSHKQITGCTCTLFVFMAGDVDLSTQWSLSDDNDAKKAASSAFSENLSICTADIRDLELR